MILRSAPAYTAWRRGHRGAVRAILVRSPWATRPRAPPVPVDLYRSGGEGRRRGRPHRTPARLMCRLLRLPLIRFPGRRFTSVGDGSYGTLEVARLGHRHRGRPAPASEMHPEANLFEPPPPDRGIGRPRVEGGRRPRPREGVAGARRRDAPSVGRHGGGPRRVEVVTGTGHRPKAGHGPVPVRWAFVHDPEGTHRDEYSCATGPAMDPAAIVTHCAGRRKIECTFREARAHLGPETTRGWCRRAVERAAPCLSGLYSVVAPRYRAPPEGKRCGGVRWPGKAGVTSSDALGPVRLRLWSEWVFPQAGERSGPGKLPDGLREILQTALAPAA